MRGRAVAFEGNVSLLEGCRILACMLYKERLKAVYACEIEKLE